MSQVIIIAGMHRSGTSMIARLLHLCGVYLGHQSDLLLPQPDNPEGFWENRYFLQLNDGLLSALNADWDCPPRLESGWEKSEQLSTIRSQARDVMDSFSGHPKWGWKDPRNSLTLPFWTELVPSNKVVICVRNPLEVADSLFQRNRHSPTLAFSLWYEYNRRILLDSDPENRIITHYEAYFRDPLTELSRVLKFLQIEVPEEHIKYCLETVNGRLRHNQSTFEDLALLDAPGKVIDLYQKLHDQVPLCLPTDSEAIDPVPAWIYEDRQNSENAEITMNVLSIKLESVRKMLKDRDNELLALRAQLAEREYELSEIHRSRAWHFVQTFRKTRKRILG